MKAMNLLYKKQKTLSVNNKIIMNNNKIVK